MAPIDWALVVSTGIGGVFGLFCLFDGTRRIALYGSNAASGYLIGVGVAICLALAGYAYWKYSGQGGAQAHFVEFVMWLVWGAAALVFGALFAREPAPEPEPEEVITKIEPVLVPPLAARAPQPAAAVPLAKPAVGEDTVPLPKPGVGGDTVPLPKPGFAPVTARAPQPAAAAVAPAVAKPAEAPPPAALPKPAVGEDTVPLPKPRVGEDTVPLPKPGPSVTQPLARSSVGEDTVPLPKPAPGTFTPKKS